MSYRKDETIKMAKVSIIVPVYNVEAYLRQALDSILCQTFTDIEVICVNDGSTDSSLKILQKYAQKDKRFVIINQNNSGVSVARNKGLDSATSDYVMFLDSDDYLLPEAVETAYQKISAENGDIGIFGFYDLLEDELKVSFTTKKIQSVISTKDYSKIYRLQHQMWNKIYRRAFLNSQNIRLIKGLKVAEDTMFCMQCYFNNPKYVLIDKLLHVYRTERENSVTTKNVESLSEVYKTMKRFVKLSIYKNLSITKKKEMAEVFSVAAYYFAQKLNLSDSKL
ncbi:MAG: glycosyltransferase, partial [Muribaculaceae bacterium]|nr:glycosyltransferase [Muribaculaceae bacterium]